MGSIAKVSIIVIACIIILAWILYVVANVVPKWNKYSVSGFDYNSGLWQVCGSISDTTICATYKCSSIVSVSNGTCSKVSAAKTFLTIACIVSIISAIFLFISLALKDKLRKVIIIVSKVLAFVALITGIIGVAVGINVMKNLSSGISLSWGASSTIGIIAIIINFIGAIASMFIQ